MTLPENGRKLGRRSSEIPAVIEILLIIGCLALFMTVLRFKDVLIYGEFLDLALKKKYGGTRRERDVIKASLVSDGLAFKIYSYPYFPYEKELFMAPFFARLFDKTISYLMFLLFSVLFIAPLIYLLYLSYLFIPHTIVGKTVSGISQLTLILTAFLMFTSRIEFKHSYEVGE